MKTFTRMFMALVMLGNSFGVAQAESNLPKKGGKVSLDFHDVDIKDIVLAISEITGKNFIIDDKIRGKITIVSSTPVSVEDAYQVFLTALSTKGFTTEEVGSITKIISNDDAVRSGIMPVGPEMETPGNSGQMITKILPLQFIDANQIQQALRTMVSRSGSIVGYGPTNSLIITDTVSNILRLEKIISKLDKQTFENSVEVVPVKFAQADDIAQKLLKIFDEERKGSGKGGSSRRDNIEGGIPVTSIMPDARSNSLIVMATRKGIERILDLLGELDKPLSGKGKSGIHIVRLKHAKSDEIAETLSSLLSGTSSSKKKSSSKSSSSSSSSGSSRPAASSGDGLGDGASSAPAAVSSSSDNSALAGIFQGEVRVVADSNTNSLIVTAAPNDFEALSPIIDQLDSRRAQVLVESLIMEVRLDKGVEAGISLSSGAAGGGFSGAASSGMSALASGGVAQAFAAMAGGLGVGGLMGGVMSNSTMKIPGTNMPIPISGATFKALQDNKYINVLSSPNIMTTDNKKAEISVGKKIPINTTQIMTANNSQPVGNVTREPVELKLSVTPQINDGDEVTLEVEQIIQEIDTSESKDKNGNPTTSERSTKTTIVANHGQTVVIGGLIKDKDEKSVRKVPLLGDVPIVGYLFRETQIRKEKTNLLLFLTPHIIRDPADMTRVSVARNGQRKAFNKANNVPENRALYDYELEKGLNMAPPASANAPKVPAKKKFDYENYQDAEADVDDGSQGQLARNRESRKVNKSVESANAKNGTTKKAAAGNPFADVRPPSSGAN